MLKAALQISPDQLRAIVPDCYAEFRPLVADGLSFFLRRLPTHRLATLLASQASLPSDGDLPRRLVCFLAACPALHKLGQVLARNRHLDLALRRQLQTLESLEPHTPLPSLAFYIDRELHSASKHYQVHLAPTALAEGSVAVVIPLTWQDPHDPPYLPPRRGVIKVLKPGISDRMAEDLDVLTDLADHLEESQIDLGLPELPYREVLNDVAQLLTHEIHLEREQQHLCAAASQFLHRGDLRVPTLLPFCTPRLTAMEYLHGQKVTDSTDLHTWEHPRIFQSLAQGLLFNVLFSPTPSILFHGDPHAGNLLAMPNGKVGILDWSLAGRLTAADRLHMVHIVLGAWTLDAPRIAQAVEQLSLSIDQSTLLSTIQSALDRLFPFRLPGVSWLAKLLDSLAQRCVRFPPRLLLFRKAFFTLQGVLHDVCPWGSLEWTAFQAAASQFFRDLSTHLICSMGENPYPARPSNLLLASLSSRSTSFPVRCRHCLS